VELREFDPSAVLSILGIESYEMLRYLPLSVVRIGVLLDMAVQPRAFVPRYAHTMDHIVVIARYLVEEVLRATDHPAVTHIPVGIPISESADPRDSNPDRPLRLIYYG